jgi:membrane associated rhomboid family serine protease
MFPLHDDNPTELFPVVTLLIMGACIWVWWYLQGAGFSEQALGDSICLLGSIPAEVAGASGGAEGPCGLGGFTWQALLSSMFLHGSWMHLVGNMWFLWIFGNNVEDSMGHLRFLVFYLLTGLVAALAQVFADPASTIPMVGASGAISAIMGAYLVLYPRAAVHTLFFFLFFIRIIPLPAWVMLGYWIVIQVASSAVASTAGGGVAYTAHIGGFAAGVGLILLFRNPKLVSAKRGKVKLARHEIDHGGWW